MAFSSRFVRTSSSGGAIALGICMGIAATALYFACRQQHLYLDGGLILKFLATGEETAFYRPYVFLARALTAVTRPLGLPLQDSACLLSALLGGAAVGLTVSALLWAGASRRAALLLGACAALAPAQ